MTTNLLSGYFGALIIALMLEGIIIFANKMNMNIG